MFKFPTLSKLFKAKNTPNTCATHPEALLVIDVQHDFTKPHWESFKALQRVLPEFRSRMPIIWVYLYSKNSEPQKATERNFTRIFNQTSGFTFGFGPNAPIMAPEQEDWIFTKNHSDAFDNYKFGTFLKSLGVKKLYLAGYADNACVRETALGARLAGFEHAVLQDLTGESEEGATSLALYNYRRRNINFLPSKDLLLSPAK